MEKVKKTAVKKGFSPVVKKLPKAVKAVAALVKPAAGVKAVAKPVKVSASAKKISDDQMFDLIQNKAYELFVVRGCVAGSDLGDWYEAEMLVKKELGL